MGGGLKSSLIGPLVVEKKISKKEIFFQYRCPPNPFHHHADAFCQVWPVGCMNGSGEDFLFAKVFLLFRHTCFSTPCLSYKGTSGI